MSAYFWMTGIVTVLAVLAGELAMCQAQTESTRGLAPWAGNSDPTDVAKRHVREVTKARQAYSIELGGTMDGENCRTPLGGWHPWKQVWESNRQVRMENTGRTDVVNPWLSNGRNNFRSIEEIVASTVEPGMTDAEKAFALWRQETLHRYHFTSGDREVKNPVKVYNIYGYNTCGDDANCMAGLWRTAGLKVTPARLLGHCITQVFYDGSWHLLDGDQACLYLLRDNRTIASEKDLVNDHDLVKRSHVCGITHYDSRQRDEHEAAGFIYDGEPTGTRNAVGTHKMDMALRPGEALVWRWGHLTPVKYHGRRPKAPDTVSNGLWEYQPDFSNDLWRKGAERVENVVKTPDGLAAVEGATGVIVWTMTSPYVFVGGHLDVQGKGAKFSLSWDGQAWKDIGTDMDKLFPSSGSARYKYHLRCELTGQARLASLKIVNDLQMAPLALPGMVIGSNRFVYTDKSKGGRKVRITHEWVERSVNRPPQASPKAIYPPDDGESDGTDFVFKWAVPEDPDGDGIADYHFELSDRSDMKWPLSPTFSRMVHLTRDARKAQFTLRYPGMLTPDRKYYWRVRAQDSEGVWGPWSKTWSFTARGPACPVEVKLALDAGKGSGTLRWKSGTGGRKAVKYRVYGSDEKGFTVSDVPYKASAGVHKDRLPSPFRANFVSETDALEMVVLGAGLSAPNSNKAYYRVVAVDEHGKRSWSSEYAEAPRPFIHSKPVETAKVGQEYRYPVKVVRSLGDLRFRVVEGKTQAGFWDTEAPSFALTKGPAWLKIDAKSGLLSGTPEAGQATRSEVVVTVRIDRDVPQFDKRLLAWGRQRLTGHRTEHVGETSQTFVITVKK